MDLRISITSENKLSTILYEKPLNMYLYIPPYSAHPLGVLTGMIYRQLHKITSLCSDPTDRKLKVNLFLNCLIDSVYKNDKLLPIFEKAILHYQNGPSPTTPTLSQPYSNDPSIPWQQ
eukprot:8660447-Ditylum_brightwellii.AAC.1